MIKYTYRISRTALEGWGRLTRNKIRLHATPYTQGQDRQKIWVDLRSWL